MGMTRAELLELLKKARKQLKKYHVPKDEQTVRLSIDTLENALSEKPQIVRCKDCKHYDETQRGKSRAEKRRYVCDDFNPPTDWFCADGEPKTTN